MCAWALRLASLSEVSVEWTYSNNPKYSRIPQVYFGASNPRFGGNSSVLSLHDVLEPNDNTCAEKEILGKGYTTYPGLLEEEAIAILKEFYGQENMNGKHLSQSPCPDILCSLGNNISACGKKKNKIGSVVIKWKRMNG